MSIIVEQITNRLDQLTQAKQYGVEPNQYKHLNKDVRDNFRLITKPIELDAMMWNKVLKSVELIQFFNEQTFKEEDLEIVRKVLNLELPVEKVLLTNMVTKENFCTYSVAFYDTVNSAHHWIDGRKVQLFELITFADTIHYVCQNQLEWNEFEVTKIAKALGVLVKESKNLENYQELSLSDRFAFIDYRFNYSYSNQLRTPLEHYEHDKEYFDLFEELYSKAMLVSEPKWTRGMFLNAVNNLVEFIRASTDSVRSKWWIEEILKHKNGTDWLSSIAAHVDGGHGIYEHEVRKLAEAAHNEERSVYEIVYGKDSDMFKLLDCNCTVDSTIYTQIRKWYKNKKKAILRLFATDASKYLSESRYSVLFSDFFQSVVNVNTLNTKNLDKVINITNTKILSEHFQSDVPLTYNEFEYVYEEQDCINREVFYQLVHHEVPIDERLRKVKELPKLEQFTKYMNKEQLVEQVTLLLLENRMSSWMKNHPMQHLEGATAEHKLFVLLFPTIYQRFQKDIRFVSDVEFMMKNFRLLNSVTNLNDAKGLFVKENKEALELFEHLGLSETFIETYRDNIIYFLDRNLGNVYLTLAKNLKSEQKHNLRLITKAELANKLDEIKFVDEDFELEIGLPLTEIQKASWKVNRALPVTDLKGYSVSEAYDYETTIRIGQNPVQSCLHWNGGQYNHCLLSLFDTNKKIFVAKDEKGRIHARAAIRLIKGSMDEGVHSLNKEKVFTNKALAFKDVEEDTSDVATNQGRAVQEELVLFLENMYSSLNFEEQIKVKKAFVQLAKQKAAELGVKLVMSEDYARNIEIEEYVTYPYHVFISYSKNGYQYLDSLTGQATESLEGSYRTAHVLIPKVDVVETEMVTN